MVDVQKRPLTTLNKRRLFRHEALLAKSVLYIYDDYLVRYLRLPFYGYSDLNGTGLNSTQTKDLAAENVNEVINLESSSVLRPRVAHWIIPSRD